MTDKVHKAIMRKRTVLLIGFLFSVGVLSFWALGGDKNVHAEYMTAILEKTSIANTVNATGTLQAVRTVQVGSQISGQVQALFADFNSAVRKGQLLARIDPRTFQTQVTTENAQLESSRARLQSADAGLLNQQANLLSATANLEVARVAAQNANIALARAQQLLDGGLLAKSEYDTAKANADSAAAKVTQAEATVQQARASIRSQEAQVQQVKAEIAGARAGLERAALNLELTSIYSPVDGVVISRSVDIGQTVAASLSAPTIFLIANDLTEMQVKASIDEADIGKISPGAPVQFTVDAYPRDTFHGRIDEVRLEPQTVQNVVTYNVIVGVANPDLKLKPGMTANITVTVASKDNVLTAPNAALRFTPAGIGAEKIQSMLPQRQNRGGEGAAAPGSGRSTRGAGPNGSQRTPGQRGILWTLDAEGNPQPKSIRVGITDGTRTEVAGPGIDEGDMIVVGSLTEDESSSPAARPAAATPLPFAMPGGGRRGGGGFR